MYESDTLAIRSYSLCHQHVDRSLHHEFYEYRGDDDPSRHWLGFGPRASHQPQLVQQQVGRGAIGETA